MTTNALVSYAPRNFSELEAFVDRITRSAMVPRAYQNKPDDAMVAIIHGAELGLPPLAALQYIAVIDGRPAVYGDAVAGVALKSGAVKAVEEWFEGQEGTDEWTAVCEVARHDGGKVKRTFSVADARRAKLWGKTSRDGKPSTWVLYPQRMLAARARGYAVRDAAPHSFMGYTVEELRDVADQEQTKHVGPDKARDITPPEPAMSPREEAERALQTEGVIVEFQMADEFELFDEYGEYIEAHENARDWLIAYGAQKRKAGPNAAYLARANLDALRLLAKAAKNGNKTKLDREVLDANAVTGDPIPPQELDLDEAIHGEPALPMQEGGL